MTSCCETDDSTTVVLEDNQTSLTIDDATTVIESCIGPQGPPASWGEITGTLSNQTDLQSALDAKLENITGEYFNDLADVNVGSPGAPEDGYAVTWDNTTSRYVLSSTSGVEVNDLTAAVTWANVPDANITSSSVTQHAGDIDLNDLGDVNTGSPGVGEDGHAVTWDNGTSRYVLAPLVTAEVNDLTASVTWANVPNANITESSVTQHEAALTILESQITDGSILARVAGNETITGDWTFNGSGNLNIGDPGFESGSVLVNTATYTAKAKINAFGGGTEAELVLHRHSNTDASHLLFARARGNTSSHTDVQQNDVIGSLAFTGWHTSSYWLGAFIEAKVDGTPGTTDMPARLEFRTSADGSATPSNALVLKADKSAEFGGEIKLEDADGSNYIGLDVPATVTTNRTWTLPDDDPTTANGLLLTTDASGVLSFKALTESDITDLQTYLTVETNDLTAAVTWANVPDANITESSVTQHAAAIDVHDLGDVDAPANYTNRNVLVANGLSWTSRALVEADISDLQTYLTVETNDLTAAVTWANVPDANITSSSVTQHAGDIDLNDLGDTNTGTPGAPQDNYAVTWDNATSRYVLTDITTLEVNDLTASVTWTVVPTSYISEASVTQHEAALTISETQISNGALLARLADNETITGDWIFDSILTADDIRAREASGSNYIKLTAPTSVATSRTWTLPEDDPSTVDGQYLTTDSSGVLSFATLTEGGVILENGFENRTDSTISFVDLTRTFTIAPAVTSFDFRSEGNLYTKSSSENIVIDDAEGLHFIYYDGTGTLQKTQTFVPGIITDYAFIVAIYWDATNNEEILFEDERHGWIMDSDTHRYLHNTVGARFDNGFALGNLATNGSGDLAVHAQLSVADGVFWDEDIRHSIQGGSPQTLSPIAQLPVYYRSGSNGDWRKETADTYPIINTGSGRAAWNNEDAGGAGVWGLTEVTNNDFVLIHIFATGDSDEPIIVILGQAVYTTLNAARNGADTEINLLTFGDLDSLSPEHLPIATVIFQTGNGYSNAVKSRIRSTSSGDDYIDWRGANGGAGVGGTAVDAHSDLSGLTNDDHTQYLLVDGTRAMSGSLDMDSNDIANVDKITIDDIEVFSPNDTTNIAIGASVANSVAVGSQYNVIEGYEAGQSLDGDYNLDLGYRSANSLTGNYNITLGANAGYSTTGSNNVLVGDSAGYNVTGDYNIAVGAEAGDTNAIAGHNILFGYQSGKNLIAGTTNTIAIGKNALTSPTTFTTTDSIGLGIGALQSITANTTSAVAIGSNAGNTAGGTGQILIGPSAGYNVSGIYTIALGYQAAYNATGQHNVCIGYQTGSTNALSDFNVLIGYQAAKNMSATESRVVAIGAAPLSNPGAYSVDNSIAIGRVTMQNITGDADDTIALGQSTANNISGNDNVAIGRRSAHSLTGTYNVLQSFEAGFSATTDFSVILGYQAGYNLTGDGNITIGYQAGYNVNGTNNVILGYEASETNAIGANNVILGYQSAKNLGLAAATNVIIGSQAGLDCSTTNSILIGSQAGRYTTGDHNVILGNEAGQNNALGAFNVLIGYKTGEDLLAADAAIVAIGQQALSGPGATFSANNAVAIGTFSLLNITGAVTNTVAVGINSGRNLTGTSCISIGNQSGFNAVGSNNYYIGYQAGYNTDGVGNIAFGYQAGYDAAGDYNVCIGYEAGEDNAIGGYNVLLGKGAGKGLIAAENRVIAIGDNAAALPGTYSLTYSIAIGTSALYDVGANSDYVVAIGSNAGRTSDGNNSVYIGRDAGYNASGVGNVLQGYQAGYNVNGNYNVCIGYEAGETNALGAANVLIGYRAGKSLAASTANTLFIHNADSLTPLIHGKFSDGNAGINFTEATDSYGASTQGGFFIGDRTTAPTGASSGGVVYYSESRDPRVNSANGNNDSVVTSDRTTGASTTAAGTVSVVINGTTYELLYSATP